MEWFKRWFNSEEYLKVYRHHDEKDAEELVKLLLNNIKLNPGDNILDMAAGFGRHAILFAKKGLKFLQLILARIFYQLQEIMLKKKVLALILFNPI